MTRLPVRVAYDDPDPLLETLFFVDPDEAEECLLVDNRYLLPLEFEGLNP